MRRRVAMGVGVVCGAAVVFGLRARRWQLRWGATERESEQGLPGDHLIGSPDFVATRAITVAAPAGRVWPWIAQLGQGRGGFYSYDLLENLVGCDIHSADEIVPQWQDIGIGDEVRLAPTVSLDVAVLEPERSLVLSGGAQPGGAQPGRGGQPGVQASSAAPPAPFVFTWAFVLQPWAQGTTRLIVRERYAYLRPWARLVAEPVGAISFLMSRKMLRGIRDRAESAVRPTRRQLRQW